MSAPFLKDGRRPGPGHTINPFLTPIDLHTAAWARTPLSVQTDFRCHIYLYSILFVYMPITTYLLCAPLDCAAIQGSSTHASARG